MRNKNKSSILGVRYVISKLFVMTCDFCRWWKMFNRRCFAVCLLCWLLRCSFVRFSVINVLSCVCTVFFHVVSSYKWEVWLAIKPGSTDHVFLKGLVQSKEHGSCYHKLFICMLAFCFCCTAVLLLFLCFHLVHSWCVSLGLRL